LVSAKAGAALPCEEVTLRERRRFSGKPLLVASAGLVVAIGGCHRKPTGNLMMPPGNLMAPPMANVCVTVEPAEAAILVNGAALYNGSCTRVNENDSVEIQITAEGYEPYTETIQPNSPDLNRTVTLQKKP
jgi:hypothetical protein